MLFPKLSLPLKSFSRFSFSRSISTSLCKPSFAKGAYDAEGKTRVEVLDHQRNPDLGLLIQSYSQMGFRLSNGILLVGPIVIFSRSVLSWDVEGYHDITADSLSLFTKLEPKLDILVLGIGDNLDRRPHLEQNLFKDFVRKHRINVEIQTTEHACSTYNFLCTEHRLVAGAFLPPLTLSPVDQDVIDTRKEYNSLFESQERELFKEDIFEDMESVKGTEAYKRAQESAKKKQKKELGPDIGPNVDKHH